MSSSVDLFRCSVKAWDSLCMKTSQGVVFVDDILAECLHWHGGALLLFNTGALDVKEFSSFESGEKDQKKGVFVVSGTLSGTRLDIIRDILESSHFTEVVIVSSLAPSMHTRVEYSSAEQDEYKAFNLYKQIISEWTNEGVSIEVSYLPLSVAPITPHLFVLPEHHATFPLLPHEFSPLTANQDKNKGPLAPRDVQYVDLPKEVQLQFKLLVHGLNSLMELLSVNEELFYLGHTSRMITSELASLGCAKNRRKTSQQRASLLVVDRSLDITSAVGHHGETLLDRILTTLPRLPGHRNDVCVDMAPLCNVHSNPGFSVVVPGCLSHPEDGASSSLFATIAHEKLKDCLKEVNRQLVETANREKLPLKMSGRPGRVSVEQLENHLSLFKNKLMAIRRNCGQLQLVMAAVQAMKHPLSSHADSLLGVEKGLVQMLGEDQEGDGPLCLLTQSLQRDSQLPSNQRQFTLEDIFLLLLFVFSLTGLDCPTESSAERSIQKLLTTLIQEEDEDSAPSFIKDLVGTNFSETNIKQTMKFIFEKLDSVATAREDLKQYSSLLTTGSLTSQATLQPLLKQLTEDIFHVDKPELHDVGHVSTGLGNLLKSGFGLWRSAAKPRPSDHPLLIIFVVGGITPTEVRQIREAITHGKSTVQVLVGSGGLVKPADLLHSVLVQDHLKPHIPVH